MTFTMVVPRRPPSWNRGPNHKFQDGIRVDARARVAPAGLLTGDLYSRIAWFHQVPTNQDVDNIAKNVHDALTGVVFGDDVQIVQCLTCKIDTTKDYQIVGQPVSDDVFEELVAFLATGQKHILYVEIGNVLSTRIVFGLIDGGNP